MFRPHALCARPEERSDDGCSNRSTSPTCREELITPNVAKLVEPPRTDNRELKPRSLDETLDFLAASRKDPLHAAFVLAIAMGLRRGEIVGLRWADLDDDPKSRRRRAVPLPALCIAPLRWHRMRQAVARARAGEKWRHVPDALGSVKPRVVGT